MDGYSHYNPPRERDCYTTTPEFSGWSEETERVLRECWKDGFSASTIGNRLGCSRNAVIGKVHRLGLGPRARRGVHSSKKRAGAGVPAGVRRMNRRKRNDMSAFHPSRASMPEFPVSPLPPCEPAPDSKRLSWADLTSTACAWIDGDPKRDHSYCGHDVVAGSRYCPDHHARSVQAIQPRRRLSQFDVGLHLARASP